MLINPAFGHGHSTQTPNAKTHSSYLQYDASNNFTFVVSHRNGSTFVSPFVTTNLTELRVGVLLPFHQTDNNSTMQITLSGASAIRMAATEINVRQLIPGAYITLVEKDSYPKEVEGQAAITQAVFSAVSLIQEGVIGLIGDISSSWTSLSALMTSTLQIPQCSFSAVATSLSDKTQYGYFFRTIPTDLLYVDAALSFITSQGWPTIGILYSSDDFGQQLSENTIMKARMRGITVKTYQSFYEDGPTSDIQHSIDTLMQSEARIIIIAAEGKALTTALTVAANSGYINDSSVWLMFGETSAPLIEAIDRFNRVIAQRIRAPDSIQTVVRYAGLTGLNQKTSQAVDPAEYAARVTTYIRPIDFNTTFSGGVFMFKSRMGLTGYPPFDEFMDKWSRLDPKIYPFGGQTDIISNEGLAYSCMMTMAQGFNHAIHNSTDSTAALTQLALGQLGQYLTPSAFNVSFLGPQGPVLLDQNGDMAVGYIYSSLNGSIVDIGNILAGKLNLTLAPIYHDGTTKVPTGVPPRTYINPGYSSPTSIILVVISSIGTLVALVTILLVIVYRKREVFKASSPLFCVLELVGFILAYISVFFFLGYRTRVDCIVIPITFHLGYSLILGNLIAKNYRVYRIFNNIFITRTVVTDLQLLKVSGGILLVDAVLLISWLGFSDIQAVKIPVSTDSYFVGCSYHGKTHPTFVWLLACFAAGQLGFATFLAIKTRSVGRKYSKYSEYKQIGISVYNIFFSALIGFIIYYMPATDYFARHYLTATMIVWASTFSLFALFIPKLLKFFSRASVNTQANGKASDLTGRQRPPPSQDCMDFHKADEGPMEHYTSDLLTLDQVANGDMPIEGEFSQPQNRKQRPVLHRQHGPIEALLGSKGFQLEAHEARMPIQHVFRYLPFLAAWDMKNIILFPSHGYFSWISERSNKGRVFSYSHASPASLSPEAFILKVHGDGLCDVLIQVSDKQALEQWCDWFNQKNVQKPRSRRCSYITSRTYFTSQAQLTLTVTDSNIGHHSVEGRRESETSMDTPPSLHHPHDSNNLLSTLPILKEHADERLSHDSLFSFKQDPPL